MRWTKEGWVPHNGPDSGVGPIRTLQAPYPEGFSAPPWPHPASQRWLKPGLCRWLDGTTLHFSGYCPKA